MRRTPAEPAIPNSFVNFARAVENPSAIEALAAACQPAQFGRGQETVLDESYRKAGKMDTTAFLARFDAERSGLMRVVHTGLLAGKEERRAIRTELYKLNVYGSSSSALQVDKRSVLIVTVMDFRRGRVLQAA